MPTYRWTRSKPLLRPDGEDIHEDETFEVDADRTPPENEDLIVRAFGDIVEAVADEDTEDEYDGRAHGLADEAYDDAVEAVEAGDADDYLDDLEAVDDRTTVQDAINARREELE